MGLGWQVPLCLWGLVGAEQKNNQAVLLTNIHICRYNYRYKYMCRYRYEYRYKYRYKYRYRHTNKCRYKSIYKNI